MWPVDSLLIGPSPLKDQTGDIVTEILLIWGTAVVVFRCLRHEQANALSTWNTRAEKSSHEVLKPLAELVFRVFGRI